MRLMLVVAGLTLVARVSSAQRRELDPQSTLAAEIRAHEEVAVLGRFSIEQRTKLQPLLETAKRKHLPTKPLIDRMVAGKNEDVAEAEIVQTIATQLNRLEAAYWALAQAGRERPDPREVALGAALLDRGASSAQLESVVRSVPPTRPLIVALEVLAKLTDRGVPVDNAVAQVSGKLVSKASDGEIVSLLSTLTMGS